MEITLQHTNEIYRNYIIGVIVILAFTSIPAIIALIKCKYDFSEYKLLWLIPAVFFL